jgi:hypothetical protein
LKKHLNTMKKQFIILAIICLAAFAGMAQKIKPSQMSPATVAAFKSKLGITAIEGDTLTAMDYFYTKAQDDSIKNLKSYTAISDLNALGASIVGCTFGWNGSTTSTSSPTLTDGVLSCYLLDKIVEPKTITNIKVIAGNTGSYTADNYNGFGLYKWSSGGTLTKVAETANTTAPFTSSAAALNTVALTAPYSATVGYYYLVVLVNSNGAMGTVPQFYSTSGNSSNLQKLFPSTVRTMFTTGTGVNTLPTTITISTGANTANPILVTLE